MCFASGSKRTHLGPSRTEHRLVLWVHRRLARDFADSRWRRSANLERRECRAQRQRRLGRGRGLHTTGQITAATHHQHMRSAHLNADVHAGGCIVAHDDCAAEGARHPGGRDEERSSPEASYTGHACQVTTRLQAHVGDHVGHAQATRLLALVDGGGGGRRGRGAPRRRWHVWRGWGQDNHRLGGLRRQQRRSRW